ncbi:hypothetical protein CLOHYLEM_06046 [[Clostridium] hylemonae DSM 15053]|uniref:Uncharacterized protein n=1 Tax=[Clostridium] hylemonae DSM 15053 TaxID=553973 RepID=C0C1M7_9FIRM|nr:hypothetical protein CLOHYLEM_06046 [[Clostridium] hylemonae DSM 15053]
MCLIPTRFPYSPYFFSSLSCPVCFNRSGCAPFIYYIGITPSSDNG